MVKCEPLPEIEGKLVAGDLFSLLVETQAKHNNCATIHNGLVDLVKKRETEKTHSPQ